MKSNQDKEQEQHAKEAKQLASRMMHKHYCEHDAEWLTAHFSPQFSWLGAGEEECLTGRDACVRQFLDFKGQIPKCNIWEEEYDVISPADRVYVVMGRMWIATDPSAEMYLKVHQRVTFVFQDTDGEMMCSHIHCSNPYQEMVSGEHFPEKIGRQSYEYVQERLEILEEETKQQNRQLEVIMSSIAGGLKISNDDDTYSFAFVSKEAAALFGYTVEEFMEATGGTAVGTVYPPDLPGALADCAKAFRDGGLTYSSSYRVRCKDGSLKWVIDSGKKAQNAEGRWMVNSLYLDITQQKLLQQRLDREQEMYRIAMEASSAVMFEYLMDSDTFISYEPRTGQGIFRTELKNYSKILPEGRIIHPDDVPTVLDNICGGRTEVFEVRCTIPDGEPGRFIWFRANSRLIVEDGKPSRVVGALHNIHSMKSRLSENSENLYRNQSALQAISGVYVSIFYVDLAADCYYAVRLPEAQEETPLSRNGSYSSQLCGYIQGNADEEDGKRIAAVCRRENLIRALAETGGHIEMEYRHARPGLWLRMEVHPVAVKDGKTKTVIIAFRNISAEKQKELEYYEEEKRAKQALEEAYASLNRANQAKSDFLSRMSHDIRTPMNAVIGMTELAKSNLGDDGKVADCLDKLSLSGGHLLELINEVLDMSKLESGTVGLNESEFQMTELFREVSGIIRQDAEHKKQGYSMTFGKLDHDAVSGDAVRVKQILINLLSNAIKYTPEQGHISVCLEEKLSSENGVGCYEFVVEDDGIGMTQEFLGKLFLPFERAEDSRVGRSQGTGLGLAITRSLVEMMNGTILVESQLNQGTRFTVTLFMKLRQPGERMCVRSGSGTGSGGDGGEAHRAFRPGTRVLLAEDNLLNQEIVEELLALSGIQTVCVADGRQAVERFVTDPPGTYGLILMDIQMPLLDGYGAAEEIRGLGKTGQRPDAAGIPIIALTANAFADDVYRAKQAGMNEHVSKPLEIGHLLDVMHRWLDETSGIRTK